MQAAPLETTRLILRTLDPSEAGQDYVDWLADPRVNRYLETRHAPQPIEAIRAFITSCNDSDHSVLFGIFPKALARHVGNIKLGPIDRHYSRADIGLMIGDPHQWGKGFAGDAIAAISDFAFETLNLHKVTAGCYADNEGSRRAFLANGFREAGRRTDHWLVDDQWMDDILLERLAN